MEARIPWDELPEPLTQAIAARIGRIIAVRSAEAGQNSPLAAIIDTVHGKVFVMGMPSGGHTAPEAERQASRLRAFQATDPAHIDIFAAASARLWAEVAQSNTSAWTAGMEQAARAWSAYRHAR